jgi:formate/nitrite transporter FocA (FNT family)
MVLILMRASVMTRVLIKLLAVFPLRNCSRHLAVSLREQRRWSRCCAPSRTKSYEQISIGRQRSRSHDRAEKVDHGSAAKKMEEIEERSSPATPVIYEVVRRLGEEEMARPGTSLWWSGVAAGLSISFSLLAQAILHTHLPDAGWRPLISNLGYSVGFLMVVLSRQQLFTENTVTAVLPVMADFTPSNVRRMGTMWGIVLAANLAGTLFAALFCTFTPVISPELRDGMLEISRQILGHGWLEMFFRGISAGFLIAAMVWLLPGANATQFHIVVLMTYLIAVGEFMHIVAGSMEAFLLLANGQLGFWPMMSDFMAPVLLGNIVGGTALFAVLSYAQVMHEI